MVAIVETVQKQPQVSEFVRAAVVRMRNARPFLSNKDREILSTYEGPVVNGDPEGRVPDDLEDDE